MTGVHTTENQYNNKHENTSVFGPGGSVAREANMISFTLNIMGQSLTFDTDGSSSLTALWQGQLEQSDNDENGRNPPFSLILGTAWNIAPACFANFCQRRLLTTEGRCFSFDQKATGFVRGEGCGGLVLDHLFSMVDGSAVVESNGEGIVRSTAMMQCGKGAVLAAPSGIVMHETMSLAVRSGGMQPGDIDVLECHAPGASLIDSVEANATARALRKDDDSSPLPLTDMKTMIGSTYAASGITGFLRALHCMRAALFGANNLLRQLNPHIDLDKRPVNLMTEPLIVPVETTGFAAVNSFGNSGTYVTAVAWGDRMELFLPEAEPGLRPAPCLFWAGGGGELEQEALPREGYYLIGSFNQWADPVKMEEADEGVWTGTVVLGDNRYEQFQVWLDGSEQRVIHPGTSKAPCNTPVQGPQEREHCSSYTWLIDGRPLLVPLESVGLPSASTKGTPPSADPSALQLTELPNRDRGEPGSKYRVRLRVAGKFRIVDWERVAEEQLAVPVASSYYVVASWNNWEFKEMMCDGSSVGLWSCDELLEDGDGEFTIVRNKDWSQAFYPSDFSFASTAVCGPDDWGRGLSWVIEGSPGDVFRVSFRREVAGPGQDDREVSWQRVRQAEPANTSR